jgi:hypothetical protein
MHPSPRIRKIVSGKSVSMTEFVPKFNMLIDRQDEQTIIDSSTVTVQHRSRHGTKLRVVPGSVGGGTTTDAVWS